MKCPYSMYVNLKSTTSGKLWRAMRFSTSRTFVVFALFAAVSPWAVFAKPSLLELRFHHPEELSGLARQLESVDRTAYRQTLDLVGLDEPGPPIPVYLAREGSGAARRAPSWGVAYAADGQVVLIPSRVPVYPNRQMESVLHHEVAHVLIDRAARGGQVPRWFHEGLALYSARDWGMEDRSRILWATIRGRDSTLAGLNDLFAGSAGSASRAYAFSGAFMHFLITRFGRETPAGILAGVASGASFKQAFRRSTGISLLRAEEQFFSHLDFWNRWVPFLTSSTTLWILISMLAVYAFKRRRQRDEQIRAQWDAEEVWLHEQTREKPNSWVH